MTTLNYDQVCIIGDFNIHICCPGDALAGEFLNLLESFNSLLHATGATHEKGHILDLVLSCGLKTDNVELINICVSDHFSIVFNLYSSPLSKVTSAPIQPPTQQQQLNFQMLFHASLQSYLCPMLLTSW